MPDVRNDGRSFRGSFRSSLADFNRRVGVEAFLRGVAQDPPELVDLVPCIGGLRLLRGGLKEFSIISSRFRQVLRKVQVKIPLLIEPGDFIGGAAFVIRKRGGVLILLDTSFPGALIFFLRRIFLEPVAAGVGLLETSLSGRAGSRREEKGTEKEDEERQENDRFSSLRDKALHLPI